MSKLAEAFKFPKDECMSSFFKEVLALNWLTGFFTVACCCLGVPFAKTAEFIRLD